MKILKWLKSIFGSSSPTPTEFKTNQAQKTSRRKSSNKRSKAPTQSHDTASHIPTYLGQEIQDWLYEVADLKRSGELERALEIARGCMEAMIEAARIDPKYAEEEFVVDVTIIQRKLKDYEGEVATFEQWNALNIEPASEQKRLEMEKRFAKAQEKLAKHREEDPAIYHERWRHYLELEKEHKNKIREERKATSGDSTTSSWKPDSKYSSRGTYPAPRRIRSWVPPTVDTLSSSSFVTVDFETANRLSGASACQIALVKVVNGKIVEKKTSLIKPPPDYDRFDFTHLHGISSATVEDAPTWPEIAEQVAAFHDGLPVYAHFAEFDSRVWKELDKHYGTSTAPIQIFCTYIAAKQLVPNLPNYKLPTVTKALVPRFKLNHHQAESDAEACARIVNALRSRV